MPSASPCVGNLLLFWGYSKKCHGIKTNQLWIVKLKLLFWFYVLLHIEYRNKKKKLLNIYTAAVDGSLWLCILTMYWFLIKAWRYYKQAFCVQLNKTLSESCLQIVWLWVGDQGKGALPAGVRWGCGFTVRQSAPNLPWTWTHVESCQLLGLQWNWPSCPHYPLLPSPPPPLKSAWGWSELLILLIYF